MDILDIFLDILLKPPQPLMGLFFCRLVSSPWKVKMFFFRSAKLTDYFFCLQSEQKNVTCRGTESNDKFDAFNTYFIQTIVLDIINMVDYYAVQKTDINIVLFILLVASKDVHLE